MERSLPGLGTRGGPEPYRPCLDCSCKCPGKAFVFQDGVVQGAMGEHAPGGCSPVSGARLCCSVGRLPRLALDRRPSPSPGSRRDRGPLQETSPWLRWEDRHDAGTDLL